MGRKRRTDKGLPERVYVEYGKQRKDGSWPKPYYYYKPENGLRIILGGTEGQMFRELSKIKERPAHIQIMADLIDDYMQTVAAVELEPKSYENELIRARFLKAFFGDFRPPEVTPQDIYEYMSHRSKKNRVEREVNGIKQVSMVGGKVAANKDVALLSKCFKYAIRKGLMKDNPCREVERYEEKPRTRYVENEELIAVRDEGTEVFKCYMDFTYLGGQRRGDNILLRKDQVKLEGIYINPSKTRKTTNKKLLLLWTASTVECMNRAYSLPGSQNSEYVFCKEDGTPYSVEGFKTMFKRNMEKALKKGTLKEKYNYHDIKAKTYSDDEDTAQRVKRASHVDDSMGRVYNRKMNVAKPIK